MGEYTGQLVGGPEDGNLVTATCETFRVVFKSRMYLDGDDQTPSVLLVEGWYVWDASMGVFSWTRTSPVNKPTGPHLRRTWGTVPIGWFVIDPKGNAYEVTDREGDEVYVKINHVHTPLKRDLAVQVACQRGTKAAPDPVDAAVDVLGAAGFSTEVISDQVS